MTTLKLYKGVDFDGVNSFPDIPTKAAFDTYLAAKQQYSQTVQYNRIGEPILIQKGYDVAISYSYGCIDTGTKKYFIIPDSINVNENGRVYLTYSVDWYTTLKYDSKISFGRSHLIKSSTADPKKYEQSINPIDMYIASSTELDPYDSDSTEPDGMMIISYIADDLNSSFGYIVSPLRRFSRHYRYDTEEYSISIEQIFAGKLDEIAGIKPDHIIGMWYIPVYVTDTGLQKISVTVNTIKYYYYKDIGHYYTYDFNTKNFDVTAYTDSMHVGTITDRLGNILYTVPYGRTMTSVNVKLQMDINQCYLLFMITFDDRNNGYISNADNSGFLYPCEQIPYNNDAYTNWAYGLKGIEIEERRIQKNKALAQGIGGSTLTGAVGGASGSPIGAAAGVVGGVASAILSYGIDTYYESKINKLEDRKYQLAQDTVIPGSFTGYKSYCFNVIQLSALQSDIDRYNAEIANFGADCNLPLASWIPSPGAYKFADVEVIADVPYGIKQNIKQKLISGIKIVDVT